MPYRHVQRGTTILWAVLAGAVVAFAAFALTAWQGSAQLEWGLLIVPVLIGFVLAGVAWYFASMTVEVTEQELRWRVGHGGWYRIPGSDIASAAIVRHPWWHGYGIRWLGPRRWTYIVAGHDTVEVRLKSGGWRRIGTDDPQRLMAALGQRVR